VGSNVVATGSGTIDLTDLTLLALGITEPAGLNPSSAYVNTGPLSAAIDVYDTVNGPANFGSGGMIAPNTGSGDFVGIGGGGSFLGVSSGYVSGSPLSSTSTWDNTTFSMLGATPGTYKWTWGSGADADSFTLVIGIAAVPEPSTWAMMLLGFAGLGLCGLSAKHAVEDSFVRSG
jgi:hypothetical protein